MNAVKMIRTSNTVLALEDRRPTHRKSGYCGHIPRFPMFDTGKSFTHTRLADRVGSPETRKLYSSSLQGSPLREDRNGVSQHEQLSPKVANYNTRKVEAWSLREVTTDRHNYPRQLSKRPLPLKRVVGFGGHRPGAAFITGETFTQAELMITKDPPEPTYEPNKEYLKGRDIMYTPDPPLGKSDPPNLDPRIPGSPPAMLRISRCKSAEPLSTFMKTKKSPWPAYPIMRGPSRVTVGGHECFLVN
eukprot:Sspe_Gene.73416::Locus_44296_Transcript_1_1_Confidence_1.000_Length_1012::g.73416::m.73416